jgi:hypothetical protein
MSSLIRIYLRLTMNLVYLMNRRNKANFEQTFKIINAEKKLFIFTSKECLLLVNFFKMYINVYS